MTAKQERTYHVPEQPVQTTVKPARHGYRCSSCGATGDFSSNQWLYGPKSPMCAFMFCRSCVTIGDIYDVLPMTERTLLSRMMCGYSPALRLKNDTGDSCTYRVVVGDRELGVVVYAGGRKLTCHGFKSSRREYVHADGTACDITSENTLTADGRSVCSAPVGRRVKP